MATAEEDAAVSVLWRKRRGSRGAEDVGRKRRPLWSEEARSIVR